MGPLRPRRAAIFLGCATLLILAAMARQRTPLMQVWADEGTFLAMTASLAKDGDLRFDERDLERVTAATDGRAHLILQRTPLGVAYSKPILYPLAAAPFYALFGEAGPILLNALALLAALWLAWQYLRTLPGATADMASLTLVTWAGGAVLLPYVWWRMADSFQASLALIGLILCLANQRRESARQPRWLSHAAWPWLGIALLALVVSMRPSNGLIAAIPLAAAALRQRWRHALVLSAVLLVSLSACSWISYSLTGSANPYRAERTTFTTETGYPAGVAAEIVDQRFEQYAASHHTNLQSAAEPRRAAYSMLFFVLGRHTSVLFYFPAAVIFLLLALRRNDAVGWASLGGFVVSVAFFVFWKPENYFGGDTFVGNRYLVSLYPAILLALPRLPAARWLLTIWAIASISYGSAALSVGRFHDIDTGSQSHTLAGIFRLLPYESTARDLAGRRDRYWAGHFLRFVDPFPRVDLRGFELRADRPASEVLIAHWQAPGNLRLRVSTEAENATLVIEDFGSRQEFAIGRAQTAATGPLGSEITFATSRPWRHHRFWFENQPYYARTLRLRLLSDGKSGSDDGNGAGDGVARARVSYFGDPQFLEQAFAYRLMDSEVPPIVVAGSDESVVALRIKNKSPRNWEVGDLTEVTVRYKFFSSSGELVSASGPIDLPRRIAPREFLNLELTPDWPTKPGSYDLEIDLVLEHVAWFQDRVGAPVLRQAVQVSAPKG